MNKTLVVGYGLGVAQILLIGWLVGLMYGQKAFGAELNGRFIWTGEKATEVARKSSKFPCSKYLEIEAPLQEEEAYRFERLMEIAIHPSTGDHFIQSLFIDLTKRSYTKDFVKHPLYPVYLKRLLQHTIDNLELELPYNIDVKKAYERYLAHQRDLVLMGMFHQKAAVCQAAADAAGYFMNRTAFGLVELFDGYLEYFKCDNSYQSWHRQERDNRKAE